MILSLIWVNTNETIDAIDEAIWVAADPYVAMFHLLHKANILKFFGRDKEAEMIESQVYSSIEGYTRKNPVPLGTKADLGDG